MKSIHSLRMSKVRTQGTRPEMTLRRLLHRAGLRFRLHRRDLPGTPDIVLPRYRTAIFVHGCFWHRHAGCHRATMPKTRTEFWRQKFAANVARDIRKERLLKERGWNVVTVWECETSDERRSDRLIQGILLQLAQPSSPMRKAAMKAS
jgi:DNA mismatch endonuclease, patch repair protein